MLMDALPTNGQALLQFWQDAGPARWFAKDAAFDAEFGRRFTAWHEAAIDGELSHFEATPEDALALVLLLDQFPRNVFRGTPRMFASDARARAVADRALARDFTPALAAPLRLFMLLPLMHSETLADQERCVQLHHSLLGQDQPHFALEHRDIIARFGRFPHRNAVLGRTSTAAELDFLAAGGFAG